MNKKRKQIKTAASYRADILKDLTKFIIENKTIDIIIARDLNENISAKEIKIFCVENGIFDIHQNRSRKKDLTCKYGPKCIDTIAVLDSILSFVEGYKLCEINEILDTGHHRYVVDVNLTAYFEQEFSN